ncbi:cohesin domain-containing protein [bacterium]|nr:cohesin domain-containing protein [bacterium]MBU1073982.1 cohesin domain-containing protein [bacterium]
MTLSRHRHLSCLWVSAIVMCAVPIAAQTVTMVPHVAVPATATFSVYVHLDADFLDVQGVEIALDFDPAIVRLDGIAPGDWFASSGLEYFFWDYTTPGTDAIHFTGALLHEGRTANGVIGICNFTALAVGISPVDFVDVDVRNSTNQDLGAAHSVGDLIVIEQVIVGERLRFGEVKSLFK